MLRVLVVALAVVTVAISTISLSAPNPKPLTPGITLIGKGVVSGSALDNSGLAGNICQAGAPANCVPKAIFGGFGSDITYTGHDDVFIAAPDRGPFDGLTDVPFLDRFYFLHITTDVGAPFPNIHTALLDTRFLKNENGENFVGAAVAFVANDELATLRLDPEGIRVSPHGTFYISDEYGPYLLEFNRQGHLSDASRSHRNFSFPTQAPIRMLNCSAIVRDAREIAAWRGWQSARMAEHCSG